MKTTVQALFLNSLSFIPYHKLLKYMLLSLYVSNLQRAVIL